MSVGKSTKSKKESSKQSSNSQEATASKKTEQLSLDQAAIEKLISDVLGGSEGLGSIFGGEQDTGLFNSSVANQAAGDLAANLIGELAKLTGKTTTEQENVGATTAASKSKGKSFELGSESSFDMGSFI